MDTRSIATVLLKVTGLVVIVYCVSQIPGYFQLTGRGYDLSIGQIFLAASVALGPLALFGIALWSFPGTIANRVVARAPEDPAALDMRPIELAAITIVGVYLLADGFVAAVRDGLFLVLIYREDHVAPPVPAAMIARIGATIAQLLIGVGLCIGAKGVSRAIQKLRG